MKMFRQTVATALLSVILFVFVLSAMGASFGGGIKAVHHGNATMTGTTSATGSGTWDKDKSVLEFTFSNSNAGAIAGDAGAVRGAITNDTTVTFTRGVGSGSIIVEWQVIESF